MAIHAHGRTKESSYSTMMRDKYDHINVDELVPGTLADVFIEPVDPETDLGRSGAIFRISMMSIDGPRFGLSLCETSARRLAETLHGFLYDAPIEITEDTYEPQDA
tara:strand:- start:515 stop:832 length:318 start_codon:yes stop_codon:yes gene_type:complete